MKTKLLLVVVLLSTGFAPAVSRAQELGPRVYLPTILTNAPGFILPPKPREPATCWHPRYDELVDYIGEMVCYEQVYIEKVYRVETSEGIECAFLASVFVKEKYDFEEGVWYPDWWGATVWVEEHSGPCEGISQGQVMSLEAKVLGTLTMAGRTYEDGITIPSLEIQ